MREEGKRKAGEHAQRACGLLGLFFFITALICNHSIGRLLSFNSFNETEMIAETSAANTRPRMPASPPNNNMIMRRRRRRRSSSCCSPTSARSSSTKTHLKIMSAASSFLLHYLLLLNQNTYITPTNAHGYLSSPRSRNYVAYQDRMWSEEDAAGSLTPVPWPEDCKFPSSMMLLCTKLLCVSHDIRSL